MKLVQVTTNDGRIFLGILKGIDNILNTLLISTVERIFSET
jgi:small nuclear ribonucleoprotein (snRNP)-like protein